MNSECGYLPPADPSQAGVCAFLWANCDSLTACQSDNITCAHSGEVCVKYSKCHLRPVCFPLAFAGEHLCPIPKSE
jgi:hypothetical protein